MKCSSPWTRHRALDSKTLDVWRDKQESKMPMQIQESKLPSYSQTKKVKLLFHSSLLEFLLICQTFSMNRQDFSDNSFLFLFSLLPLLWNFSSLANCKLPLRLQVESSFVSQEDLTRPVIHDSPSMTYFIFSCLDKKKMHFKLPVIPFIPKNYH